MPLQFIMMAEKVNYWLWMEHFPCQLEVELTKQKPIKCPINCEKKLPFPDQYVFFSLFVHSNEPFLY